MFTQKNAGVTADVNHGVLMTALNHNSCLYSYVCIIGCCNSTEYPAVIRAHGFQILHAAAAAAATTDNDGDDDDSTPMMDDV